MKKNRIELKKCGDSFDKMKCKDEYAPSDSLNFINIPAF